MRTPRAVSLLLVALATAAILASVAGAGRAPQPTAAVKTAATLPCASYPWVQPSWITRGGTSLPVLPAVTQTQATGLPYWIPLEPLTAVKTAATLPCASYPWVQLPAGIATG